LLTIINRTKPGRKKNKGVRTQVTALARSGKTQKEIAQIIGVCRQTVGEVYKEIEPDLATLDGKILEYRRGFQEKVPITSRVDRLAELMDERKHPIVALKAIQVINELDGIHVQPEEGPPPQHQPMFSLPAGLIVQVHVGEPVQNRPQDTVRQLVEETGEVPASNE